MRDDPSPSGSRPPQDPNLLPPIDDDDDPSSSDRRPPQDSNLQHQSHDAALFLPRFLFEEAMTGEPGPSNHTPPQDSHLQARIDAAAARQRRHPSPQPPISSIPAGFFLGPPRLDLSSQPSIATAASSSSSLGPPGHRPTKDPVPQHPIASPPPPLLVIHGLNYRDLKFLRRGSRSPIIISADFPLKLLPLLWETISAERNRPPESQRFEVANPETLDQLQRNYSDLVARAEALDHRNKQCHILVDKMWDIRTKILFFDGIPEQGINLQIAIMNTAINDIIRERKHVRRLCGR